MSFSECKTSADFLAFFQDEERAFRHTNYYHYTSLISVNSILETKELRLSQSSKTSNDAQERDIYSKLGGTFSACFSTGTSESLPLWYLYSGIDGKGARIGLAKNQFKLLKQAKLTLYQSQNDTLMNPRVLEKGQYRIEFRDILYIGEDTQKKNFFRCKYNGAVVNNIPGIDIQTIRKQYEKFIKGLIWFYEKETRILVEITDKDLLQSDKSYKVALDLTDVMQKLSIRLAPEFGESTSESFEKYPAIKDWLSGRLEKSEYAGQVKMNLKNAICKHCPDKTEKEAQIPAPANGSCPGID